MSNAASAASSSDSSLVIVRVSDDHGIVAVKTPAGWRDVAGFAFSDASVAALDAFARGRTRSLVVREGRDVVTCSNPRLIAVY